MPTVLPPAGRERLTKNDPDYWLESEQILKAAAARLRELKPLIELLTTPSPLPDAPGRGSAPSPVAELELSSIVEGIAESAGSYGGPDYTSIVKAFDPVPLRQTQPALDLTVLFNGFKPLFAALNPQDVNAFAMEIIKTLQGAIRQH